MVKYLGTIKKVAIMMLSKTLLVIAVSFSTIPQFQPMIIIDLPEEASFDSSKPESTVTHSLQ
jgi:hypothetical protein